MIIGWKNSWQKTNNFCTPPVETWQPILPYSIQKPPCHVEIVDDSLHRSSDDYWLKKHPHETFPRVLLLYNGLIWFLKDHFFFLQTIFVPLPWKLENPYYHILYKSPHVTLKSLMTRCINQVMIIGWKNVLMKRYHPIVSYRTMGWYNLWKTILFFFLFMSYGQGISN